MSSNPKTAKIVEMAKKCHNCQNCQKLSKFVNDFQKCQKWSKNLKIVKKIKIVKICKNCQEFQNVGQVMFPHHSDQMSIAISPKPIFAFFNSTYWTVTKLWGKKLVSDGHFGGCSLRAQ